MFETLKRIAILCVMLVISCPVSAVNERNFLLPYTHQSDISPVEESGALSDSWELLHGLRIGIEKNSRQTALQTISSGQFLPALNKRVSSDLETQYAEDDTIQGNANSNLLFIVLIGLWFFLMRSNEQHG